MAWTETCKIDFQKQIEHKKEQGYKIKDALLELSDESGISIHTLRNWLYPDRQEKYEKEVRPTKNVGNDIFSTDDLSIEELEQIEKAAQQQIIKQGNDIKKQKNQEYKEKEAELKDTSDVVIDNITNRYKVYNCDILEAPIEDNSLDVIITDPPYPREFLGCWDKLAEFSATKLKDGGVLLAMSGQSYLPEVYRRMNVSGLNYYWTCCIKLTVSPDLRQKRLHTQWKPLLFYVKGDYKKTFLKSDVYDNLEYKETVKGQSFHKWGQSYTLMKRIIEDFTYTDDLICDPFTGGGTTISAGLGLKRKMIGIEVEKDTYNTILRRLADV